MKRYAERWRSAKLCNSTIVCSQFFVQKANHRKADVGRVHSSGVKLLCQSLSYPRPWSSHAKERDLTIAQPDGHPHHKRNDDGEDDGIKSEFESLPARRFGSKIIGLLSRRRRWIGFWYVHGKLGGTSASIDRRFCHRHIGRIADPQFTGIDQR
jgi:hypothetical protein